MDAGGLRLFLIEPTMGFGRPRLIMAPVGVLGARLPSGIHGVEGFVAFPSSSISSSRTSLVVNALPTAGGRVPGSLFAAPIGARIILDGTPRPRVERSDAHRKLLPVSTLRHPVKSRVVAAGCDWAAQERRPRTRLPLYGASAGNALDIGSSSTGRRGFGWSGATRTHNSNPDDDDDDDDTFSKPADIPSPRSKRAIASWIKLARLQTTFEVAFDAGVVDSGRDLRRVLDAIGDNDITAPGRPRSWELCSDRICAVIGEHKLEELLKARIPFEDEQFGFNALAGQSMIEAIEHLTVILHSLLHPVLPSFVLCNACPIILQQLLKAVCEFSTLTESTKFKRPQSSIRYPMLEAHARALEHVCAIALDVYEEVCQEEPKEEWAGLRQELRNRRITLFEQDVGVVDYILAIGVTDTKRVFYLLLDVALWVRVRASAGSSN